MAVRLPNDAIYLEPAACKLLGVERRWLRKHVQHSAAGRKRWYSGADINAALFGNCTDATVLAEVECVEGAVVYFVQQDGGGPIKIGHTSNLVSRLGDHQNSNPVPVRLVGAMPGGRSEEMRLHERFSSLRLHGEWFRPAMELIDFIESLRNKP